jgi:hypothetical protein
VDALLLALLAATSLRIFELDGVTGVVCDGALTEFVVCVCAGFDVDDWDDTEAGGIVAAGFDFTVLLVALVAAAFAFSLFTAADTVEAGAFVVLLATGFGAALVDALLVVFFVGASGMSMSESRSGTVVVFFGRPFLRAVASADIASCFGICPQKKKVRFKCGGSENKFEGIETAGF